jgi:hypothetical protein
MPLNNGNDNAQAGNGGVSIALLQQGQQVILHKLDELKTDYQQANQQIQALQIKQATCEASVKERLEAVEVSGHRQQDDLKTLEKRIYGLAGANTALAGLFSFLATLFN